MPTPDPPPWELDPKGHKWKRRKDGTVEHFEMGEDFCEGPLCASCGFIFCIHCAVVWEREEGCPPE